MAEPVENSRNEQEKPAERGFWSNLGNKLLLVREGGQRFVASIPAIPGYLADLADKGAEKLGGNLYDGSAGSAIQNWTETNVIKKVDPVGWALGPAKVETDSDRMIKDGTETVLDVASIFAGGAGLVKSPKLLATAGKSTGFISKLAGTFSAAVKSEKVAQTATAATGLAKGTFNLASKGLKANSTLVNILTYPLKLFPGTRPLAKGAIYGTEAVVVDNLTGKHGQNAVHDFVDGRLDNDGLAQKVFNTAVNDPREYNLFGDGGNRTAQQKQENPLPSDSLALRDMFPEKAGKMADAVEDALSSMHPVVGALVAALAVGLPFRMLSSGGGLMSSIIGTVLTVGAGYLGWNMMKASKDNDRLAAKDDKKLPDAKTGILAPAPS